MPKITHKIGFIGAGNMSEAMAGALLQANIVGPSQIYASDTQPDRLSLFQKSFGIKTPENNLEVISQADVVVLAVKPQILPSLLETLSAAKAFTGDSRKQIISIAAGVSIQTIADYIYNGLAPDAQANLPIIRVMPNTPCLVMAGMSGMCANAYASDEDLALTQTILSSMGKVIQCTEADMDAVTAVSGSGPAYVFYLVEAMIQAGVSLGLPSETSQVLATETFRGAMKLLTDSGEKPEALRKKVTSPGGTTEAAIAVMDQTGIKERFISAISRAAERSKELSQM